MANEEQLSILKQGVEVWNKWRKENRSIKIELTGANLGRANLSKVDFTLSDLLGANLSQADLEEADLRYANMQEANLGGAILAKANLQGAILSRANLYNAHFNEAWMCEAKLTGANLTKAGITKAYLKGADLSKAKLNEVIGEDVNLYRANLAGADLSSAALRNFDLTEADLTEANLCKTYLGRGLLSRAKLNRTKLSLAEIDDANFGDLDLSLALGLEEINHRSPSTIGTNTLTLSKGKIPEIFLRGCGLSDWEIEQVRLYNPDLSNAEINDIQYKMYDLRATQAVQISPLFISYSHGDNIFVNKLETQLNKKGIRFWRDIHDMKAGRIEKQIDRAISQNRTVLLVLSGHSLSSDWVEYEVRTARGLEKEVGKDVLCPIALDDSWKTSPWPKRIMEQIKEYNILNFSAWEDDSQFEGMFRKLIDGLELFYKDKSHGE